MYKTKVGNSYLGIHLYTKNNETHVFQLYNQKKTHHHVYKQYSTIQHLIFGWGNNNIIICSKKGVEIYPFFAVRVICVFFIKKHNDRWKTPYGWWYMQCKICDKYTIYIWYNIYPLFYLLIISFKRFSIFIKKNILCINIEKKKQ